MKPLAIVAALVGGLVGAAIWATVSVKAGQVVLLLWAIGLLAGSGARLASGGGVRMGTVCAAITVVAVALGRYASASYVANELVPSRWEQQAAAFERDLTVEAYENLMRAAQATSELANPLQYAAFLVRFELTPAETPEEVTAEELRVFEGMTLPILRRMREEQPSYERWRSRRLGLFDTQRQEARRELTVARVALEGLRPQDRGAAWNYVFILLAVITAYIVGRGPKAPPAPRRVHAQSRGEAERTESRKGVES